MFVTYENWNNPHVTIHRAGCTQVMKRGGEHKYGQGGYKQYGTLQQADSYAKSTGLRVVHCSYCKPERSQTD